MTAPSRAAPARPEIVTRGLRPTRPAWVERATSADHKTVATMYLAGSLAFLVIALTEFVLTRVQLIVPDNTMIDPEIFGRLISAQGVTTMVLFAIPLALALIGHVVPLQIGARGVAFPRLGALSFWLYAAGGVTLYATLLYTPSEAGTIALPPLSDTVFSSTAGVDGWIVGTGLATLGFVLFALNMVVTVRNMRAPGLAWRRMPSFSWAATVICHLLLVVGPVLLAALTMLFLDRHFDAVFFDAGEGGAPLLYQHLTSFFLTGAYLIVFLFAAGAISEIVATLAGKPIFSRRAANASFIAIGTIGPLAWMQSMYSSPLPEGWGYFAMAAALALAVPIGVLLFSWLSTLWGGAISLRAPMLYALGAISALAYGLAGEFANSVIPVGWLVDDTAAAGADTTAVMVGGAVLGGFAALHYWMPKISGRLLGEGLAKIALVAILGGLYLYAVPMFLAGLDGQPVDVYQYTQGTDLSTYNAIASLGAFAMAIGVLIELVNVAIGYRRGVPAGHDPWGGSTLEWYALSPPPAHNFDVVPDVRSAEPLRDIREAVRLRTSLFSPPEPLPVSEPAAGDRERAGEGEEEPDRRRDAGEGASVS